MTREQAIDIEVKSAMAWKPADMPEYMVMRAAAETVDVYVALGMLKLDEPKSVEDEFINQLIERGFSKRDANVVRQALDYNNFRIVEK